MAVLSTAAAHADDYTLTITPAPENGPYTAADLEEIRIYCPEQTFTASSKTEQYLNGVQLSNGVNVRSYKFAGYGDDHHTIVLRKNDSYAAGTVDPAYWDSGSYTISMMSNYCYLGTALSAYHVFSGFEIKANDKSTGWPVLPADNGAAIDRIDKISVKFTSKSKVNDVSKNVTITRNGEPVWSTGVNNASTAAVKTTGKGAVQITYNVSPALTQPGVYQIVYDEDAYIQVENARHTSAQHVFTYIIPEPVEHTVVPAPAVGKRENNQLVLESNGEISEFGRFTITYPEGATVELNDHCNEAIAQSLFRNAVVTADQAFIENPSVSNLIQSNDLDIKAEGNTVSVTYPATSRRATGPTKFWCQAIPAGVWNITLNGVTTPNSQEYIYWQISDIVDPSLTPADNGDYTTLHYAGHNDIYVLNDATAGLPTLRKGKRTVAAYTSPQPSAKPYNELTFTTSDDLSGVAGNCIFEIPAGYFGLDVKMTTLKTHWTNPNPVRIAITLPGTPEIAHTVSPAPETESLTRLPVIKVSFPDASEIEVAENACPTLTMPDGTMLRGTVATDNAEENSINCNFEADKWIAGKYIFALAPEAVSVDGDPFGGFSHEYNLTVNTGVENVAVRDNATTYTVYSLDGILLHRDAPASVLNALPRGLYIVNNTKVVIR